MSNNTRREISDAEHLKRTAEVRQVLTDCAKQLEEIGYDAALVQGVMVGQGVHLAVLSCGQQGAVAWLRDIADNLEKVDFSEPRTLAPRNPTHTDFGSA